MKRIILGATEYTPSLDLNPENLSMNISGVSRPENVGGFYQQVIDWVKNLSGEIERLVPATLKIKFQLEYCNSSSQKYLLIVLEKIVALKEFGLKVTVDWYYDDGDDKMLEDGEDIADAIGLDFTFHPL